MSTLKGSYSRCKGRCLIRVLTLGRGILPAIFRKKWLLWNLDMRFDCAGSHKVCGAVLGRSIFPANFRIKWLFVKSWPAFRLRRLAQSLRPGFGLRNFTGKFLHEVALVKSWHAFWLRRLAQSVCPRSGPNLGRGIFPVKFGKKWLFWAVDMYFDCAGSHKVSKCVCPLSGLTCQQSSYGDLVQRSCHETSYGALVRRHCIKICCPDLAQRPLTSPDRDLAKRPLIEILYRDLAKTPLTQICTEILPRGLLHKSCQESFSRELVQRSCQEASWGLAWRSFIDSWNRGFTLWDLLQRSSVEISYSRHLAQIALHRDLAQQLLQRTCQGDLAHDLLQRSLQRELAESYLVSLLFTTRVALDLRVCSFLVLFFKVVVLFRVDLGFI